MFMFKIRVRRFLTLILLAIATIKQGQGYLTSTQLRSTQIIARQAKLICQSKILSNPLARESGYFQLYDQSYPYGQMDIGRPKVEQNLKFNGPYLYCPLIRQGLLNLNSFQKNILKNRKIQFKTIDNLEGIESILVQLFTKYGYICICLLVDEFF